MRLILSKNWPLNVVLLNEDGKTLYKTKTPSIPRWPHQTTSIYRVDPDPPDQKFIDEPDPVEGDVEGEQDELPLDHHWTEIAQIDWHVISSSTLRYKGVEMSFKEYLPSEDMFDLHRSFTASDGLSYTWNAGAGPFGKLVLVRDDEQKAEVAHFHRPTLGLIGKKHNTELEVLPDGLPIIDDIVVTFLYLDKLRETRHRTPD